MRRRGVAFCRHAKRRLGDCHGKPRFLRRLGRGDIHQYSRCRLHGARPPCFGGRASQLAPWRCQQPEDTAPGSPGTAMARSPTHSARPVPALPSAPALGRGLCPAGLTRLACTAGTQAGIHPSRRGGRHAHPHRARRRRASSSATMWQSIQPPPVPPEMRSPARRARPHGSLCIDARISAHASSRAASDGKVRKKNCAVPCPVLGASPLLAFRPPGNHHDTAPFAAERILLHRLSPGARSELVLSGTRYRGGMRCFAMGKTTRGTCRPEAGPIWPLKTYYTVLFIATTGPSISPPPFHSRRRIDNWRLHTTCAETKTCR